MLDGNAIGFQIGDYDRAELLVIDPVLSYSKVIAGDGANVANGIAVDAAGNAYLVGTTSSLDFPTLNPYQAARGGFKDVFVLKLDPNGVLVYSTYLGGSNDDIGRGIAIDSGGNAYVTGWSFSTNFPTANAFQAIRSTSPDLFITKLNSTGSGLVYSTYLGGNNDDRAYAIAVDSSDNVYITGQTFSSNFPTANPFQAARNGTGDVFVTKLNAAGLALVYSTYLGGAESFEIGNGIAADSDGNAYVVGQTVSPTFPVLNAFQAAKGDTFTSSTFDAFITKFNPAGAPIFSTYLGGGSSDLAYAVALDSSRNIYVTGTTGSFDFPTKNTLQPIGANSSDAFVTELNAAGTALIYSTFLGGNADETGYGIAVDSASGKAIVTGKTSSPDFPAVRSLQSIGGGGIFASTDGASTWSYQNAGLVSQFGLSPIDVNALAIDPLDSSVYAATVSGVFKSEFGVLPWTPVNQNFAAYSVAVEESISSKVYAGNYGRVSKSTDAGATWTESTTGLPASQPVNALAIDPGNDSIVYAGTGNTSLDGGVYKSVDGGSTWSPATTGLPNVAANALLIDPANTATLYAAVGSSSGGGVYKSTNGGTSWSVAGTGLPNRGVSALAFDPTNTTNIYAASLIGVYKTTDAGANWTRLLQTNFDLLSMAVDPSDPSIIYLGTETFSGLGVLKSTDGGATWTASGLTDNRVIALVIDPFTSTITAACGQLTSTDASTDMFVTALNTAGASVLFSTYLGGTGRDEGHGIAMDSSGKVYLAGVSYSPDLPPASIARPAAANRNMPAAKFGAAPLAGPISQSVSTVDLASVFAGEIGETVGTDCPPITGSFFLNTTGYVGDLFEGEFSGRGGTPPYIITLDPSSQLPPGLKFENGVITGVMMRDTNQQITVHVRDANGCEGTITGTITSRPKPVGTALLVEKTLIDGPYDAVKKELVFVVTVTNTSGRTLTDVALVDSAQNPGVSVKSVMTAAPGWVCTANESAVCKKSSMSAGETVEFFIVCDVSNVQGGDSVMNQARGFGRTSEFVTDRAAASFTIPAGPPPPPATTSSDVVCSITASDPVNTFTGELLGLEAVDFNLGGPLPLTFARYYASKLSSAAQFTGPLGRNRLHTFEAKLTVAAANATAILNNGRRVEFTKSGTVWTLSGRADIPFQLVESGGNFVLGDPRTQLLWTFDSAGKLVKMEDGRGNAHTLTYNGSQLASVSDGLGRVLTFTYGAGGLLARVADQTTRHVDFTYSGTNLATATDPLGHITTYNSDGSGNLLSITHPRGNAPISQTYDSSSRVSSQTELGANTTTLSYGQNATTITDPTGKTRIHGYTDKGGLSTFTDEENKTVALTSDSADRRSAVTDRIGRTTAIAYHATSGKPSSVTAPDGAMTSFTYALRVVSGITFFDLATITFADGTNRSFTYEARGNLISAVDQLGKTSTFTYDANGRVLTATNPTGGVTTLTYDAAENLATSRDSDTGATTYAYDAFSRLTKLTHPDGTHVDIIYDAADRVTSITDERGKTFAYTYDVNDNVTVITDPANAATTLAYDALDRVIQVTDRLGKPSSRTFDTRNWVSGVTDELNHTTTMVHDTRQRMSAATNAGNETTSFGYNDEAELTSVTDPLAHTTALTRNQRGRVIAVSDALGNATQLERDALQRVTKVVDPVGRRTALTYDARGLLVGASRDGTGPASYTRDAAGRLLKITDPNQAAWSFGYTPAGRLSVSSDPVGNTTGFGYDPRGRLATIMQPEGGTCAIAYDEAGDVTQLNCTGGPMLDFTYDALRRLTGATGVVLTRDAEGRMTNSQQSGVNFSATYDDAGRLTSVGYNNNAFVVTYTYDSRDRLVMVSDNDSAGANSVIFAYDAADRVTNVTRSNGVNATLTYDAANRLTRIQDGTFLDLKFTLNADGDITATDFTAPLLPTIATDAKQFAFDAASQVKSTGFTYDARGRLTASPGHTFTWDGASRLVAFDGTTLGYDAFGDVAMRTIGGATTRLFYHHSLRLHPLVAERNETNSQFSRFYVWTPGGTLLYSIDAATHVPSFYHYDRVGSTLALTDGDGAVTDKYAYSPYGEPLGREGASTQPFTFVGAFGIRAEGPLYQMRARYYDPLTARFLSRDPRSPLLADVRTLDPYLYALGNSTRYIDADGAAPSEASLYEDYLRRRIDSCMGSAYPSFAKYRDAVKGYQSPEPSAEQAEAERDYQGYLFLRDRSGAGISYPTYAEYRARTRNSGCPPAAQFCEVPNTCGGNGSVNAACEFVWGAMESTCGTQFECGQPDVFAMCEPTQFECGQPDGFAMCEPEAASGVSIMSSLSQVTVSNDGATGLIGIYLPLTASRAAGLNQPFPFRANGYEDKLDANDPSGDPNGTNKIDVQEYLRHGF